MAVRPILLDTNAYVAFKQGQADAVEVVQHTPRIGLNSIVLGELLSGFSVGTREQENRQELEQFLASDRVGQLMIDLETAEHYARVYRELRRRGGRSQPMICGLQPLRYNMGLPFLAMIDISMKFPVCRLALD